MNILIVGGTGLIGSAIAGHALSLGHRVFVASRGERRTFGTTHVPFDISKASEGDWTRLLQGIDAVVNCAGVLQTAGGDSAVAVHHTGILGLFKACEAMQLRKIIHFSAMGVDRETPTEFSRSKLAGDLALMQYDLDWVILRPSVVLGRAAYGASALARGLAASPLLPLLPATGQLQVVWIDDVVATVSYFLFGEGEGRQVVEIAGPGLMSFPDLIRLLREWLRLPRAAELRIPALLSTSLYKIGDAVSSLGWRPAVRSTTQGEITRGAVANAERVKMPFPQTSLDAALKREPASVQERWFAGLYLVKPLVFGVLAAFWIATALVSLGPGWDYGLGLMREGGVEGSVAALTVIAGALSDLLIGLAIAFRRTSRAGLYAAITISFVYAIVGSILVPRLWADPLGPMLKIWPIIVLHLVALATLEDR